ncbi:nickel pincer cofactor biosynthesis protein LarC [Peptacetobacter sp. AB845]|uniref:nickel pincer cofactor biosynthesis protein LarC n=1 Tax=Peptacetobacter sp. AB845 TaxID=3388429 RepID=UPI0039C9F4AB
MSKRKLYLECYSGISGDMFVASLLDLGADLEVLEKSLKSLESIKDKFEIKTSRVVKSGLDALDFSVVLDVDNHDHDMEYLHSNDYKHDHDHHDHDHSHEHSHDHDHHNHDHSHEHCHEHSHDHDHHDNDHNHGHSHGHGHSHEHVGLIEIQHIINSSEITENAKKIANKIFDILADAEAKAHGKPKTEVHFHEVGAVDSIVDIVAAAVCIDNLGIEEVIIPALYEGVGTVRCQHGVLPVPVPAVLNIINAENLTLSITGVQGEFVTPTGAAIAAAIRTEKNLPERFRVVKTGIGAGKRNYERPSLLRSMIIEEEETEIEKDKIVKMETNIDDCTGEALGYVMQKLMDAGARDVHYMPVFMKKNRPGYQLNVICKEDKMDELQRIIFEDTTSIGIRIQYMDRKILERRTEMRETSMGTVQIKICGLPSGERIYPEHDSIARICKETGRTWQDVYRQIIEECK